MGASFRMFLSCTSDSSRCSLVPLVLVHRGGAGFWLISSSPLCVCVYCESCQLIVTLTWSRTLVMTFCGLAIQR